MNHQLRVGLFFSLGLALLIGFGVYVNDHPFWYRPCKEVDVLLENAQGLKQRSPVRSLGLDIGYIRDVKLDQERVRLTLCITAPVKILPTTKTYVQSSGFLGDKIIELKPVQQIDEFPVKKTLQAPKQDNGNKENKDEKDESDKETSSLLNKLINLINPIQTAFANETSTRKNKKVVPLGESDADFGKVANKLNELIGEVINLTRKLEKTLSPEDIQLTIKRVNQILSNIEKMTSGATKLPKVAEETLNNLKEATESLKSAMTKVNTGDGTISKLINDPTIADEAAKAIKGINNLLGKVNAAEFFVSMSAMKVPAYGGSKGIFSARLYPSPNTSKIIKRYYQGGVSSDPRGKNTTTITTTETNGVVTNTTKIEREKGGLQITVLLGMEYDFGLNYPRLDLKGGLIESGGGAGLGLIFDEERTFEVQSEFYYNPNDDKLACRVFANYKFYKIFYATVGIDSFSKADGKIPYMYGAGVSFRDDDIKILFGLR